MTWFMRVCRAERWRVNTALPEAGSYTCPGSLRVPLLCSVEPGNFLVQASTQIKGGLMEALPARPGPQVELVALSLTLEAAKDVPAKMRREGALFAACGLMERAAAPHLLAPVLGADEAEQIEDLGHAHSGPQFTIVDPRHDTLSVHGAAGFVHCSQTMKQCHWYVTEIEP